MKNNYINISQFGQMGNPLVDNPLSYCMLDNMDNKFIHGSNQLGQNSKKCQMFMSDYCSKSWDDNCKIFSENMNRGLPNNIPQYNSLYDLSEGEILILNTASKKYLINKNENNIRYEPFDPNVANSPLVSYKICNDTPMYSVNPNEIDNDPVMNKILNKPTIALSILVNIYNTMKRNGTLESLLNTKLGQFFSSNRVFFEQKLYRGVFTSNN